MACIQQFSNYLSINRTPCLSIWGNSRRNLPVPWDETSHNSWRLLGFLHRKWLRHSFYTQRKQWKSVFAFMYVSSPLSLFRFRFLVFSLLEQENANTPNVLGIYENSPRSPMFSNFTGLYMKSLCSPLLELMRVCVC